LLILNKNVHITQVMLSQRHCRIALHSHRW